MRINSNKLERFIRDINRLGVNDGYPNDIHEILTLQERKWLDSRGSNRKTEDDNYELHHRDIRATFNTIEEYFTNNKRGFNNPSVIHNIDNRNFDVEIYSRNLRFNKLKKIEQDIIRTFKEIENQGIGINPHKTQTIKLYIFDNNDDYRHYGNKLGLGLGDEGGKHYYIGQDNILSKIYVYQDGDVHNLVHEMVHANIAYITVGKEIPTVINEGIADKIQYNFSKDSSARGRSIDVTYKQLIGDYDLSSMLSLEYSNDFVQNSLVYRVGHALVMYFDWRSPEILRNYLIEVRDSKDPKDANKILYKSYDKEMFKTFLVDHSTETEMKSINALKVECGEKLATVKEIVGNQYQDVTYYELKISLMDRMEIVGKFSSVLHFAVGNTMRVISADIKSYFDLSQDFNFMKVVNHRGELKLVYCDRDSNEYKDSQEYQKQLNHIKQHYSSEDYYNIIEKLTYFGLNSVRNIKGKHFVDYLEENMVFSLKALGAHAAKSISGISIYSNKVKIGELTGEATYVKEIGNNKYIFHDDQLMNMYTTFTEAYIAIRQEDQEYKISFIEGRKVEADRYFDIPHIHLDPLFEPSINNIQPHYLTTGLLISNTDILNHADSAISQYSASHKASKHTIEKGQLLDNKGTEREIDDVYEAEIVHLGSTIDIFRNIGFYISESGSLFISDYGKGVRYQLPNEISHLKLVKFVGDDGTITNRLIPVTQDGNEFPAGMPNIADEYRLIDPIFAHKYEKEDHSHQHITIGLINFDQYAENSLFKIKYDPNDYHIRKDQQCNILRASSTTTYTTKVKIYDESGIEELGILSNDFHQFKDKIFISFDYHYSYKDFLMSYAPKIEYKILSDGTKVGIFEQSESDISNNNYQDYKKVVINNDNTEFSKQSDVTIKEKSYDWIISLDHSVSSNNIATPDPLNIGISNLVPHIPTSSAHNITITGISAAAMVTTSVVGTLMIAAAGVYGGYRLYHYCKEKSNTHEGSNHLINATSATGENMELQSLVQIDIVRTPKEAIEKYLQEQAIAKDNGSSSDTSTYESFYEDVQSRAYSSYTPKNTYANVSNLITSNNDLPPPIPPKISDLIIETAIDLSGELAPPPDYT